MDLGVPINRLLRDGYITECKLAFCQEVGMQAHILQATIMTLVRIAK